MLKPAEGGEQASALRPEPDIKLAVAELFRVLRY